MYEHTANRASKTSISSISVSYESDWHRMPGADLFLSVAVENRTLCRRALSWTAKEIFAAKPTVLSSDLEPIIYRLDFGIGGFK